jgi:hypothetical protein
MRRVFGRMATAIAAILGGMVLFPVFGEFFVELAREYRLYEHPSQRLSEFMNALSHIVSQPWFIGLTIFFVGLALGAWLDLFLGRRERRRLEDPVLAREILRFLDVHAIPALEYSREGLAYRKDWTENDTFPRDFIVGRMCLIADSEMEAAKTWAAKAQSKDNPTADDLQHIVCEVHRALFKIALLHDLYKMLDSPGWVVEN